MSDQKFFRGRGWIPWRIEWGPQERRYVAWRWRGKLRTPAKVKR